MRSAIPLLVALACPIGMCLVPMLLMRRRGERASCHQPATRSDDTAAHDRPVPVRTERNAEDSLA